MARLNAQLQPVLTQLWTQGYTQGLILNYKRIVGITVAMRVALLGGAWLQQIVGTTLKLAAIALATGQPLDLSPNSRAEQIAVTEVTRSIEQANADSLQSDGVALVRWRTGGPDPCELCIANEAAGPWPLGTPFPSGAMTPPQHPNCRCHLEKAE